jgi:CO/xanthine dehydrogenase Mo-binding subunit
MERLLDFAARELGIDVVEIRRRNYIPPDKFPYDHGILFQDSAPLTYDSGNYEPVLQEAADRIGFTEFRRTGRAAGRAEGKRLGLGIVSYIEGTGIGPYEGARVTVEPSGSIRVATGVGTQGQGHFTTFAQIVADALGVHPEQVDVSTGDTRSFGWGTGTFASRGIVVAGTACHEAALLVRAKALKLAAELLEAAEGDLVLAEGQISVRGSPGHAISLAQLAVEANPLRGAVKPGTEPGLEATAYFGPARGNAANGVHAMIVEVDPDTMMVKILRYVVVHDAGKVIHPVIVEGQIQGGVAHGIGNSFYEQLVWDDNGQLLNASLMDYLLPTALDVPTVEITHRETPSPLNPLGVKGVGEAGAIPTGAAFAQAVEDALAGTGVEILEIPLSPSRLFALVQEAERTHRR